MGRAVGSMVVDFNNAAAYPPGFVETLTVGVVVVNVGAIASSFFDFSVVEFFSKVLTLDS